MLKLRAVMDVSDPDASDPPEGARSSGASHASDVPPWPLWTVLATLLLGIGLWVLASLLVEVAAAAGGSSISHPSPGVSLALDFVFDLAFVAAALYFTVGQLHARAVDFGYRRVHLALAAWTFGVAAVGYYVLTLLYASVFRLHGHDKLPNELGATHSTAALVGAAVFVCVLAPIAEELFFRGFIFGTLRKLGLLPAALITGLLFGLVHAGSASPQYLVPLGLLGFVLCLLRWRTGSLYPCMALHSFNNCLALGINQLHWSAPAIAGLVLGAAAVIGALTVPLAGRPLATAPAG